jgi:hypothetical protein
MNTWVNNDARTTIQVEVGMRLDVHVLRLRNVDTWSADKIAHWVRNHEELLGEVEAVEAGTDGVLRIRVLDTWVAVSNASGPGH